MTGVQTCALPISPIASMKFTTIATFTLAAAAQEKRQIPDEFAGYLSLAQNFIGNGQYSSIWQELATNTEWQNWIPAIATDVTALSNLISHLPTGYASELASISEFLATAQATDKPTGTITKATQTTTKATSTKSTTTTTSSDDNDNDNEDDNQDNNDDNSNTSGARRVDGYFASMVAGFMGLSAGMVCSFK